MRRAARSTSSTILLSLCLLCLAPTRSEASLVGYWSFDGCTTTDASGHGADLTANGGPTCVAGRFGNAWLLNGDGNQYLDRGPDGLFTPGTRAWSVAAWEKTNAGVGFRVMVEWYRCGADPRCNITDGANYIMALDDGHPYWDIRDDGASSEIIVDSTLALADDAWHFMVGTMDPATDVTKLYVDGALRATIHGSIGSLTSGDTAVPLEVGRHFRTVWGQPDYYFPGALDEVRIFDEELSATAVATLFTNNAVTAVEQDESLDLAIDGSWPNPSRNGRLDVSFVLPVAGPARLALFDVGGRLISRQPVVALGAGRHQVELGASHRIPPGVYMLQLTQGARSRMRRVTVLD